ncbi:MAG: type IV toxin-antitoxin system AbiEi family antitoxin domain-containing protein [Verrucomicrobia bacterium]|nr:type IV toxin-antitoxin system AbiEi family antitoxin domain-containing protein [Verrucomicrobiota bacterium]
MKKNSLTTKIISSYREYLQIMNMETFLAHNQIFTTEELRATLGMKKANSTLDNLLSYHLRQGHIIRIRKGLYYTIPRGADAKTHPIDPYLIASKMTVDATLAYHTSLGFHGKLHSLRTDFIYVTQRKLKPPFIFRGTAFKGISIPKGTLASPALGIEIVDYQGCKLRVTTLERTFVDILDRPTLIGNWEEIWRSLESIEYLNLQQVLAYAKLLNNATTYARIAFFLDQHRDTFSLSEKDLATFDKFIPKSPHYLDLHNKEPNQLIARWNLIVPKSLLQRTWEEPHENF